MSRFIVEYNPTGLNLKTQAFISKNLSYSMISSDESSAQFEITQVLELLEEYKDTEDFDKEIKVISQLIKEGVSFIEI